MSRYANSRRSQTAYVSHRQAQSGFTIIELLIATAVFAVVLLVVIAGVLQFTRQYYKGVISANTQSIARALVDDVTRGIQFGGSASSSVIAISDPSGGPNKGYCVGQGKRYSYVPNLEITGSANHYHALVTDTPNACGSGATPFNVQASTANLPAGAKELLGGNMRISKFDISQVNSIPGLYNVSVRVVYGDDDLLCSPSLSPAGKGGCDSNAPDAVPGDGTFNNKDDLKCRITIGSQFCAVAELTTTVQSRVQ
jgi:prepilin-type N-terminal cleavage/methylation domain-containing protein